MGDIDFTISSVLISSVENAVFHKYVFASLVYVLKVSSILSVSCIPVQKHLPLFSRQSPFQDSSLYAISDADIVNCPNFEAWKSRVVKFFIKLLTPEMLRAAVGWELEFNRNNPEPGFLGQLCWWTTFKPISATCDLSGDCFICFWVSVSFEVLEGFRKKMGDWPAFAYRWGWQL